MSRLLLDPVAFWSLLGSYEDEPLSFDAWAIAHMHDYSLLRAREKAPQIGFSFLSAAEATWEAIMFTDTTTGFVSVGLNDAHEKIYYSRKLYEELPEIIQRWVPMPVTARDELHFGDEARPSRLISRPNSSGLRGPRMSVYLDEIDFYQDGGRDAFRAGLGRISRGGRLTMGSTVFGTGTKLDEVVHGNDDSRFSTAILPWQVITDEDRRARVEMLMGELSPEEAREEYECERGGGALRTFDPNVIRKQMRQELVPAAEWLPKVPAVIGYDVGKSLHPSVLVGLEQSSPTTWSQRTILEIREGLTWQRGFLIEYLTERPTCSLVIDAIGIGEGIADELVERFGSRVIAFKSTARPDDLPDMAKREQVTELRAALDGDLLELVADIETARQLERTSLGSDGRVEQPGSKRRSHYDRFWALAYAWYGTRAASASMSVYARRGLIVVEHAGRR